MRRTSDISDFSFKISALMTLYDIIATKFARKVLMVDAVLKIQLGIYLFFFGPSVMVVRYWFGVILHSV